MRNIITYLVLTILLSCGLFIPNKASKKPLLNSRLANCKAFPDTTGWNRLSIIEVIHFNNKVYTYGSFGDFNEVSVDSSYILTRRFDIKGDIFIKIYKDTVLKFSEILMQDTIRSPFQNMFYFKINDSSFIRNELCESFMSLSDSPECNKHEIVFDSTRNKITFLYDYKGDNVMEKVCEIVYSN